MARMNPLEADDDTADNDIIIYDIDSHPEKRISRKKSFGYLHKIDYRRFQ